MAYFLNKNAKTAGLVYLLLMFAALFTTSCGIFDSRDDAAAARGLLASGGLFHLGPGIATNLFLISEDRDDITQLTNDSLRYHWAKWSPDGRWIIAWAEYVIDNAFIFLISADGSSRELLLTSAVSPVWSPDGSKIAYSRGGDIYLLEIETGDTTHLGAGVGGERPWDWSETHGIIVTSLRSTYTQDSSFYYRDEEIYTMDLEGNMTPITSDSTKRRGGIDLSPDGEHIVHIAGFRPRLYVTSLLDTTTRAITLERELMSLPVWSPDGSHLAISFSDRDSATTDGIYLLDVNSGETTLFYENCEENASPYGNMVIKDWR